MSAIAPVKLSSILAATQLTTSATVSVDNTFDPEGGFNPNGVVRWVNRVGGIAVGYPSFSLSVRPPNKTSRVTKVTAKLVSPTLEATSPSTSTGIQPAPTKAYECTCVMEFMLPERSTLTERQAFFSLVHSLFATTINANDGAPSDATGSPLILAVTTGEAPY